VNLRNNDIDRVGAGFDQTKGLGFRMGLRVKYEFEQVNVKRIQEVGSGTLVGGGSSLLEGEQ